MLTETMPDVVLLQETLLRSGMEYKPPQGYTTADRKDGVPYDNKPRGGVLTLVEDLPFTKVAKSENTWTDFVTIKLDTAEYWPMRRVAATRAESHGRVVHSMEGEDEPWKM